MNILLLTEYYGDATGGTEVHVKGFEDYMKARGHRIFVVTPNWRLFGGIPGKFPLLRSFYYFLMSLRYARQADLIYTIYTLSPLLAGVMLKWIFRKKMIAGIWATEALDKINRSSVLKFIVRQPDDLFYFTDAHRKMLGFGSVVPNWVDFDIFRSSKKSVRSKYPELRSGFVITFVGRPSKGKGLHLLIKAIRKLPGCKLLVVGKFPGDEYFRELAEKEGVESRVVFTGKVPHDELAPYYNAGDVFCLPSTEFEGQGIVFLEAMACGLPVVGSDLPAIRATIGSAGMLIRMGSADAIVSAIKKLKRNAPLRKKLRQKSLEEAKKYEKKRILRYYESLILRAIGKPIRKFNRVRRLHSSFRAH